jgi:hypothetical protein
MQDRRLPIEVVAENGDQPKGVVQLIAQIVTA